jgi:phosphatidylethanolamine-binding protein
LLYEQPEGFDGKPVAVMKRLRYNLGAFEKEAKLGAVIAFNYYTSN